MTNYNCGHESNGAIIMDNNELSILNYFEWSETVGVFGDMTECFDCYLEGK